MAVRMAAKNQPAADCSTGEQKAMLIALTLAHCELAGQITRSPACSSSMKSPPISILCVAVHCLNDWPRMARRCG
jgi:hypothetical protein